MFDEPKFRYLSIGKAAAHYGVSTDTLRRWTDAGKVKCIVTAGGHRRYKIEEDLTVEHMKEQNRLLIELLKANDYKEMDMKFTQNNMNTGNVNNINMKDLKTLSVDKAVIKEFIREFISSNMNCREAGKAEYNTLQNQLTTLNAEHANYQTELDAAIKVCTYNNWSLAPLDNGLATDKVTEEYLARRIIRKLTHKIEDINNKIAHLNRDIALHSRFQNVDSELAAAFNVAKLFGLTVEVSSYKDGIIVEVK